MDDHFNGGEVYIPDNIIKDIHLVLCGRCHAIPGPNGMDGVNPVNNHLQGLLFKKLRGNTSTKFDRFRNSLKAKGHDIPISEKSYRDILRGNASFTYRYLDFLCLATWDKSLAFCLLCKEFPLIGCKKNIPSEEYGKNEYLKLKNVLEKKALTISVDDPKNEEQLLAAPLSEIEEDQEDHFEYEIESEDPIYEHIFLLRDYVTAEKFSIEAIVEIEAKNDKSIHAYRVYALRAILLRQIDNDFAASNDLLRKCLSIAKNLNLPKQIPYINSEIAFNLAYLGDVDFAETVSKTCLAYYLTTDDLNKIVSAYLSHARVLRISDNFSAAKQQVKYAIEKNNELFLSTNAESQASYLTNKASCDLAMANICYDQNIPVEAIDYVSQALKYFQKEKDTKTVADLNFILASCEIQAGRMTSRTWMTALSEAKKGYVELNYQNGIAECIFFLMRIAQNNGLHYYSNIILVNNKDFLDPIPKFRARCMKELADYQIEHGSYNDGISLYYDLISFCESEKLQELLIEAETQLGKLFKERKMKNLAETHLNIAVKKLSKNYDASEFERAITASKLAEIDWIKGNYSTALATYKSCAQAFQDNHLMEYYDAEIKIADLYIATHQPSFAISIWHKINDSALLGHDWYDIILVIAKIKLAQIHLYSKQFWKSEQYILEAESLNKNRNHIHTESIYKLKADLQDIKTITEKNLGMFDHALKRLYSNKLCANGILYWYDRYSVIILNHYYHISGIKAVIFSSQDHYRVKHFQKSYKSLFDYYLEIEDRRYNTAVFEKFPYPFSTFDKEDIIDEKPSTQTTISSDENYIWNRIVSTPKTSKYAFEVFREAEPTRQIYCEGYCDGYYAIVSNFFWKSTPQRILSLNYFPFKYKNYGCGNWRSDLFFCYQLGVMPIYTKDERNNQNLNIIREININLLSVESTEIKKIFTSLLNTTKDEVEILLSKLISESSKKYLFPRRGIEMTILIIELDLTVQIVYPLIIMHK